LHVVNLLCHKQFVCVGGHTIDQFGSRLYVGDANSKTGVKKPAGLEGACNKGDTTPIHKLPVSNRRIKVQQIVQCAFGAPLIGLD